MKLVNIKINSIEKTPYPDMLGTWVRFWIQKEKTNAGYYTWVPALVVEKK